MISFRGIYEESQPRVHRGQRESSGGTRGPDRAAGLGVWVQVKGRVVDRAEVPAEVELLLGGRVWRLRRSRSVGMKRDQGRR